MSGGERIIARVTTDSRDAIRAARAAMNDAIARRDPDAIAKFFLPSYHVVTARNLHRHGPQDSAKGWAEMFARDKDRCAGRNSGRAHRRDGRVARQRWRP